MLRTSVGMLAMSLAVVGCGGGGGGGAQDPGEIAAEFQGPIASSDVARGEELYNGICLSCHSGGAPAIESLGWEPAAMRQQVRRGQGRMPAIGASRLSADDLEAILAYLATIGAVNGGAPESTGDEAPAEDDAGGEAAGDDA